MPEEQELKVIFSYIASWSLAWPGFHDSCLKREEWGREMSTLRERKQKHQKYKENGKMARKCWKRRDRK